MIKCIHGKSLLDSCDKYKGNNLAKERTFTEAEIAKLQHEVHKITGDGEVMALFNKLLGISAG